MVFKMNQVSFLMTFRVGDQSLIYLFRVPKNFKVLTVLRKKNGSNSHTVLRDEKIKLLVSFNLENNGK